MAGPRLPVAVLAAAALLVVPVLVARDALARRRPWPAAPVEAPCAATGRRRGALAKALCVALLAVGVLLTVRADAGPLWDSGVSPLLMLTLFAVLHAAAQHYSVDIELRREVHSVTLTQVPLALG